MVKKGKLINGEHLKSFRREKISRKLNICSLVLGTDEHSPITLIKLELMNNSLISFLVIIETSKSMKTLPQEGDFGGR